VIEDFVLHCIRETAGWALLDPRERDRAEREVLAASAHGWQATAPFSEWQEVYLAAWTGSAPAAYGFWLTEEVHFLYDLESVLVGVEIAAPLRLDPPTRREAHYLALQHA
jgi:hypothetical protein